MLADPTRTAPAPPRWVTGRAGPLSSLTGRPTPPPTAQRARACVPAARSTKQLSEAYGPLLGAGARLCFARPLGPDMGHGLLWVGQDQSPPVHFEHFHTIDQDEVPPRRALDQRPHE